MARLRSMSSGPSLLMAPEKNIRLGWCRSLSGKCWAFKYDILKNSALLVFSLFFSSPLLAVSSNEKQAEVTAAFIYQISKFITWPEEAFNSAEDSLSICVLGNENAQLEEKLTRFTSKKSKGRPIQIHSFESKTKLLSSQKTAEHCHILFMPDTEWDDFTPKEIDHLKQTTLLIGETRHFLKEGGMLALILVDSKISIFVNPDAMTQSQIKLESRLRALTKTLGEEG